MSVTNVCIIPVKYLGEFYKSLGCWGNMTFVIVLSHVPLLLLFTLSLALSIWMAVYKIIYSCFESLPNCSKLLLCTQSWGNPPQRTDCMWFFKIYSLWSRCVSVGFAPRCRRSGVTVDPEQGAVERPRISRNGEKLLGCDSLWTFCFLSQKC